MSKDNKFKNESQDARRHDQQHASHNNDKNNDKMKKHAEKPKSDKRK